MAAHVVVVTWPAASVAADTAEAASVMPVGLPEPSPEMNAASASAPIRSPSSVLINGSRSNSSRSTALPTR